MTVSLVKRPKVSLVKRPAHLTAAQDSALSDICSRYRVTYVAVTFRPVFDLPSGWVAGWVGDSIYVGCAPDGSISS